MVRQLKRLKLLRETDGVAMVEFGLILMVLLLMLLGVLQFGLCYFTKYAITCASREGARYGVIYHTDGAGDRIPPVNLNPTIQQVTKDYLAKLLPSSALDNCQVNVVPNDAYQTGGPGMDLIVQVTCQNPWDLLGGLVPSLSNLTFSAETTMKCE